MERVKLEPGNFSSGPSLEQVCLELFEWACSRACTTVIIAAQPLQTGWLVTLNATGDAPISRLDIE